MTDFTRLNSALIEHLKGRAKDVRVKRGNELQCRIARGGDALTLAEFLRRDFNAELILMVANDRRTKANANARARRSWARSAALDSHLNNLGV